MPHMSELGDKVVVLWSGGIDSTGLIFVLLKKYNVKVFPIFVRHGQKNELYEEKSVWSYTKSFEKEFPNKFHQPFMVTTDIPAKEFKKLDFKKYFFLRNSDLINNAVRYAIYRDIKTILISTTIHDLLDGQKEYLKQKELEINKGTEENIALFSPFHEGWFPYCTKESLIEFCREQNFDLSKTRSCYLSTENPCEKCDACKRRMEAFASAIDR